MENIIGLGPYLLVGAAFFLLATSFVIRKNIYYHIFSAIVSVMVFSISTYILIKIWNNQLLRYTFGGWKAPYGVEYRIDKLAAIVAFAFSITIFAIMLFSIEYYKEAKKNLAYYYVLLLGAFGGVLGTIYAGDLFHQYVIMEVLSVSIFGIAVFGKDSVNALKAVIKYSVFSSIASSLSFLGLVVIYYAVGTVNMEDFIKRLLTVRSINALTLTIGFALALVLYLFKSAIFPNHFWLPDLHSEAPTPVSALLSGVTIKVGLFVVVRYVYTLFPAFLGKSGMERVLLTLFIIGAATSFYGSMQLFLQRDIKRFLAYSSLVNVGMILMGISSNNVVGISAAIFLMISHSFGKSLLFILAGIVSDKAKSRDIEKLSAIFKSNRLLSAIYLVGLLQIGGVPPLGGFFSKFFIAMGFVREGQLFRLLLVLLVAIVSLVGYLWHYQRVSSGQHHETEKISIPIASYILTSFSAITGILGLRLFELIQLAVSELLQFR
ncbi:proton-conducting transporter transmembrane domain-containing protein [Pseudothermotoga thermarum]|uniref:NADH/Ubiquinone/plastoquinone (Complex I) n=1 Tax=Pseudothermotoga thermarum DSM 5069 TaxID=688269 RepID=F7YU02_9THEM|nr:proton-conducting transporter membrane subunit [Pseudothermotoga thermarum]AEH51584.1 NADH/Ubiquinone/plastoquinone (complex I) [Pseudothermotoga thermarum DSM 5069]